ncbi:chemotaxis protein CheA [Natronococcus pandeyae]|uniref:Chemotaxis protein CheA n=1 Tax=Natronococcus pandeyae TaxID=2055836 RepID=A0A8J8Q2G6_9EURY|nr:chemotaxis protein CheA [Natronococcus pandeyae]TYL37699.1 chemotaxis protein CheA [Natronococcus pandeyae]
MTDYVTDFVQESEEQITELNNALLALERSPDDDEAMERIFRIAHTLKGNCGAMGLEPASDLAHAIEDLLDAVRSGDLEVSAETMDGIFDAVDELETMIDEVADGGEIETDPSATIESLRAQLEAEANAATLESPSPAELDDVLARFEPPADPDHDAYLARLVITPHEEINYGELVVEALIDAFDLIGTEPPRSAIEADEYGDSFDAVFGTPVGETAIASGLEPVEEVDEFEIVAVTDRLTAAEEVEDDLSTDDAQELEVDDLLDEFDEFDNLDERVEEFEDDDLDPFDDMGDAGSFDDLLGDEVDDLEPKSEPTADSETGSTAAADDPTEADDGDTSDTDESVDDAGAVFDELKDEVEMVGFDELQDELAELEFDEFDDDEEVSMSELLGEDGEEVEDDPFLDGDLEDDEAGSAEDESTPDADEPGLEDDAPAPEQRDDQQVARSGDELDEDESPEPDEVPSPDASETERPAPDEDPAVDEGAPTEAADAEAETVSADADSDATADDETAANTDVEPSKADAAVPTESVTDAVADEDDEVEADGDSDTELEGEDDTALEERSARTEVEATEVVDAAEDAEDAEDAIEPASTADERPDESDGDEADADEADVSGIDPDTADRTSAGDLETESATAAVPDDSESDPFATEESESSTAVSPADSETGDAVVANAEDTVEADDAVDNADDSIADQPTSVAGEEDGERTDDAETVPGADGFDPIDDESRSGASDDTSGFDESDDTNGFSENDDGTDTLEPSGFGEDEPDESDPFDIGAEDDAFETTFGSESLEESDPAAFETEFSALDDGSENEAPDSLEFEGDSADNFEETFGDPFADDAGSETGFDDAFADDVQTDDTAFAPEPDASADGLDTDATDDGTEGPIVDEPDLEIPDVTVPDRSDLTRKPGEGADDTQSVRVDVEQIDTLLTLVEGLVTSRVRLRHAIDEGEELRAIAAELDDLEDLTTELQETVTNVRLVPLNTVTNRLPRVVRDIAREQDKEVAFEMTGEDVELDRSILDRIGDPLIHLVRNAVDHGVEPPEQREAADKPREGSVTVTAERARDRVTITVADDGSGLDPDRLRSEAVEADILTESEASDLSDDAAYDLVFHPGLSTADEVTDVSGRGVGMDVVERTIEDLDGTVTVDSDPGEGTTVTMTLPVSIAIDDVLFLESGGEEFGIPLKAVDDIQAAETVETADDDCPFVSLDEALETPEPNADEDGMIVRIRDEVRSVALGCDHVHGQQEVVVTPFEGFMNGVPGVSGATVRGRGEVVTILDVTTL